MVSMNHLAPSTSSTAAAAAAGGGGGVGAAVAVASALPKKLSIAIIGGGAIGLLLAGRLSLQQHAAVTLVDRCMERVALLRQRGITMHDTKAKIHQHTNAFTALSIEECHSLSPSIDVAIVAVKSHATVSAGAVAACMNASTVLTLQNGLFNTEILSSAVTPEKVISGVAIVGSSRLDVGVVEHTPLDVPGIISLGRRTKVDRLVDDLAATFVASGLPTNVVGDIKSIVWSKLIINAAINPVTALLRSKNGVMSSECLKSLINDIVMECVAVAHAAGVPLLGDSSYYVARVLEVARNTATNTSSMCTDALANAPTEVEQINGAIISMAKAHGNVPVPVNMTLLRLMRSLSASKGHQVI